MSKPVIITCAVTGSIHTPTMSPHLPIAPTEIADALKALRQKYGWQMVLTDFMSRLSGRYHRRAYIRIEV